MENEKLQLTKEISNLTKTNTELSHKYETEKRTTNVGKSTNSPDMFQKRSGKPQKRRGQTNVDKVKIDDNKMKVEMKENEELKITRKVRKTKTVNLMMIREINLW